MTLEQMRDALDPRDLSGARSCLAAAIAERDALRAFAQDIMQTWPEGDVDGGELQEAAERHGLLRMKDPAPFEPCGNGCACAEYYNEEDFLDGSVQCYERTTLLSPNNQIQRRR